MSIPAISNAKICGVMDSATATLCADLGFGAIGFVFYAKSPRCVTPALAREIASGIPQSVARVGVVVDMPEDEMVAAARTAGLTSVQLHGNEPPQVARRLQEAGFKVIKAVRRIEDAHTMPEGVSILLECGTGTLPGGNGAEWDWGKAADAMSTLPIGIAGGLRADNIGLAMAVSHAEACDVSSGAEAAPRVKNHAAIAAIARELARLPQPQRLFWRDATK